MMVGSSYVLAQSTEYVAPSYFQVVLLGLLALGAIGWLVAAVLGFARARAFGPAFKWFALSAVALVAYHLQFVIMVVAANSDSKLLLSIGAFFNLFVVVGAVCAIIGFARMTGPR